MVFVFSFWERKRRELRKEERKQKEFLNFERGFEGDRVVRNIIRGHRWFRSNFCYTWRGVSTLFREVESFWPLSSDSSEAKNFPARII